MKHYPQISFGYESIVNNYKNSLKIDLLKLEASCS
jgi:hypothetical protein